MNKIEILTKFTNRSENQTKMLLGLVNNDFNKLMDLEWCLHNNSRYHSFVPSTSKQVEEILSLKHLGKSVRLSLLFWENLKTIINEQP